MKVLLWQIYSILCWMKMSIWYFSLNKPPPNRNPAYAHKHRFLPEKQGRNYLMCSIWAKNTSSSDLVHFWIAYEPNRACSTKMYRKSTLIFSGRSQNLSLCCLYPIWYCWCFIHNAYSFKYLFKLMIYNLYSCTKGYFFNFFNPLLVIRRV